MTSFAVQYLEPGPGVADIEPQEAAGRLATAFERLPISHVLLGWNLPAATVQVCKEEVARRGAKLYRWHPLLTGDGTFFPRPEWQAVGLSGEPVPGFRGLPEFTFVCPNRPAAREAVLDRLQAVCDMGAYDGLFLDRIRYPSPASDPERWLACVCPDCRRLARAEGLDLADIGSRIRALLGTAEGVRALLHTLLDPEFVDAGDADLSALRAFLSYRAHSVTELVGDAARVIHGRGLEVGLDCFSPALTWMVGQEPDELDAHCEWIKIMSYGHALGPAGLPYELLDLADWLTSKGVEESEALKWLSQASHLPLPATRDALREEGLAPAALAEETRRARANVKRPVLAGIELVELEGITCLREAQIGVDVQAFREAGAEGLALSWDLWHIPLERLDLVRSAWEVAIVEAGREDKSVLRNLLELYLHDFSEYNGQDVDEHGLYGYDYLDPYWTETGRHAFLVRVRGKLAGFALVRDVSAEEGTTAHSMAEFFVLRKYRRRGVGRVVAQRLFDRFPGRWRVAQEEGNRPAQAFWREVVSGYTGSRPREVREEGWQGPILQFESRGQGATARAG